MPLFKLDSINNIVQSHYDMNLSITPGQIVRHPINYHRRKSEKQISQFQAMREVKIRNGQLSLDARRKIRKAVQWLVWIGSKKPRQYFWRKNSYNNLISFITLTLPATQQHTDVEIKKLILQPFLQALRDKFKLKYYCWKAELQKNENIHFHITTDLYIPHMAIRKLWNFYLNKLHYIDRFELKFNHKNPPSTEIKSVKKIGNLAAYMTKYLTKEIEKDSTTISASQQERYNKFGKMYGISQHLANFKSIAIDWGKEEYNDIQNLMEYNNVKCVEFEGAKIWYISLFIFDYIITQIAEFYGKQYFQHYPLYNYI